ncbi:MAG: Sec-independent protein translocase protein TatB [Azoarcus sp.]|jgi:sec-independent protein translocase protein TatB|nr:Sec-independent protein translocase protein TatB [Azoarcus sp.]
MFDLGFSEIAVIAIVLLVVVGPERLPRVARAAGHLLGRFHRYVAEVKADIRREIQIDELKTLREQAHALDQTLRAEVGEIQSEVREALILTETAPAPDDAGGVSSAPPDAPAPETSSALPAAVPTDKT